MKTLLRWGVLASVAAATGVAPAVGKTEFTGENVTITVAPPRVTVEGTYTFYNAGDEPDTLEVYYPFPRGPGLGNPENISVRDAEGGDIPFSWKRYDVVLEFTVPPESEAAVSVAYEQPCEGCEYKYILASKRDWQRPIGKATFAVEVPPQLAPVEGSYELEEVPAREGVVRYELHRDDWYPDVDLVLHWERPDFYFGSTALEGEPDAPEDAP
jgi:hypothetical protein